MKAGAGFQVCIGYPAAPPRKATGKAMADTRQATLI
jgi:hypothetical protein